MNCSSLLTKIIRNFHRPLIQASWNGPQKCLLGSNTSNMSPYQNRQICSDGESQEDPSAQVPTPTWSIQELDLASKRPPLSDEELDRLSKLALVDVRSMKPEDQESLGQDLANMLRMIDQVTRYSNEGSINRAQEGTEEDIQAAAQIYDVVRGVEKARLRKSAEEDHLRSEDGDAAKDVWESMLRPKTKRMGGRHEYFAIRTKTETPEE